jgi:fumarate reductase subunit C
MPDSFWSQPRMRRYLLFDATGIPYLLVGFVVLRVPWALASGEEAWTALLQEFAHPLYLLFHALTLVSVFFVGVRFFGLFGKAQPPRIGFLTPPPSAVVKATLYAVWCGITLLGLLVLGGLCSCASSR